MIKESKYCTDIMKKHFNKELVMTKKDNEDFKNSTKCWICDVKVRDNFHITGKYRTSMQILNGLVVLCIFNFKLKQNSYCSQQPEKL